MRRCSVRLPLLLLGLSTCCRADNVGMYAAALSDAETIAARDAAIAEQAAAAAAARRGLYPPPPPLPRKANPSDSTPEPEVYDAMVPSFASITSNGTKDSDASTKLPMSGEAASASATPSAKEHTVTKKHASAASKHSPSTDSIVEIEAQDTDAAGSSFAAPGDGFISASEAKSSAFAAQQHDTGLIGNWVPPQCASWCHWSTANCKKDACRDCEKCKGPAPPPPSPPVTPSPPALPESATPTVSLAALTVRTIPSKPSIAPAKPASAGPCNAGCNEWYCEHKDLRCTGCSFCHAGSATMCQRWCSGEHHCKDDRCGACPHCDDGEGGDGTCDSWCADHHCDDERCNRCAFCAKATTNTDAETAARPVWGGVNGSLVADIAAARIKAAQLAQIEASKVPTKMDQAEPAMQTKEDAPTQALGAPLTSIAGVTELQCQAWCSPVHCLNRDTRCAGCDACATTGASTATEAELETHPLICARFCKVTHCRTDDRCVECEICAGIAAVWPPPPPPTPPPTPPLLPPILSPPPMHPGEDISPSPPPPPSSPLHCI